MPTMPPLPSNPTALRKMLTDLGLTPVSHNPSALRQQLIQHYDAHPEATYAPPVASVPTPVRVPSPRREPAQRTIEGIAEENRKVVASHQQAVAAAFADIDSKFAPIAGSDGMYHLSNADANYMRALGYGGYIPPYDRWLYNRHPVPQWEFDQMVSVITNNKTRISNYHQAYIEAANRAAEAEIRELQRNRLSVSVSPVISVNPAVRRSVSSLRSIGFPRTGSSYPIPVPQGDFMRGILNKEIRDPDTGKDRFAYTLKSKEPVYDQDLLRGIFRRKDGQ